jgi:hypothetical protein
MKELDEQVYGKNQLQMFWLWRASDLFMKILFNWTLTS